MKAIAVIDRNLALGYQGNLLFRLPSDLAHFKANTLGKTIVTIFLTVVAMLLIIFVLLLLVDLVNQVYSFLWSIYQELMFRA